MAIRTPSFGSDRFEPVRFSRRNEAEDPELTTEQLLKREARRYPELSPKERVAVLARLYENPGDDEALKQLMMPFQPLALAMAGKLLYRRGLGNHGKIQPMDLVNTGNEAFLKALHRKGIKLEKAEKSFVNYVTTLYARTMLHYIWRNLRQVPETHNDQVAFLKLFAIAHQLENKNGRQPTPEEILTVATEQEMEPRYLTLIEKMLKEGPKGHERSMDSAMGDSRDDRLLAEYIADPSPTPEHLTHMARARAAMVTAAADGFTRLTPLQQYAFARHYGLWPNMPAIPQTEIAQELVTLTDNPRGRESITVAEFTGMKTLAETVAQALNLSGADDLSVSPRHATRILLDEISPAEAATFLPPHDIMLLLVKLGQRFGMKNPMTEISPVNSQSLGKLHPALPKNHNGYMIRYDWTQQFKPKAFNERLVEIQEFLAAHADLHLVYKNDLNPFSLDPNNHNRELRMVVFPPVPGESSRPQVFMEKSEGTGLMREMLKAKLDRYTPEEQVILSRFFDLDETGEELTTRDISRLPEVPYSQAYVSKIKNRIVEEVQAEIRRRYPNGSPIWEKAPAGV